MAYNHAVETALAAFSHGHCYYPSCRAPAVVSVEGEVVANLRRTPIRGKHFWGPRWDPALTPEQRDHWANLILLCHPHHVWVAERRAERYTPEQLHEWKFERERHTMHGLTGLGRIGDDDLHRIARDSVRIRQERLRSAGERLDRVGESDLAEIVRVIDASSPVVVDASDAPAAPVPAPRAAADDLAPARPE